MLCFIMSNLSYKVFGRIIKQWQHQCIVESNKSHVVPFNIFINARYHHMKVVGDEVTLRFSITSLGKFIRKSDVLSIEEKRKMLAQLMCQPTFPSSLNLIFKYFCMQNFFIKGCSKHYGF
jgi:hypothetical protein